MDPATITIHGVLDDATVGELVKLAMRAGAGLAVQPRVPVKQVAGEVVGNGNGRSKATRTYTRHALKKPATKEAEPTPLPRHMAGSQVSDRQATKLRRWNILQTLESAGDAGLSYRGLLLKAKKHPTWL